MSSSRDTRSKGLPLPPELLGRPSEEYRFAERAVAEFLDLEPGDVAAWDNGDKVLIPNKDMLQRCQALINTQPSTHVVDVLVALLRESYHLRPVHALIVQLTERFYKEWLAGDHGEQVREVLRELSHAFQYGVRPEDHDLLVRLCSEESFRYDQEGDLDIEDLRKYWMDSLAKVKDDRVGDFLRRIVHDDIDTWNDYRAGDAIRGLARFWQPADEKLVTQHANHHPDSYIRQIARRILKRHAQPQ